jgi:hypothetical protein
MLALFPCAGHHTSDGMGVHQILKACSGSYLGSLSGDLPGLCFPIRAIHVVIRHDVWLWFWVPYNHGRYYSWPNFALLHWSPTVA